VCVCDVGTLRQWKKFECILGMCQEYFKFRYFKFLGINYDIKLSVCNNDLICFSSILVPICFVIAFVLFTYTSLKMTK
jgi:hypothetical protein